MDLAQHARRRGAERPVATWILTILAIVVALFPGGSEWAQFQRGTVFSEPWRWWSCHVSHFTIDHLVWDWVVVLGLGIVCEARWPARTRWALLVGGFLIPLSFLVAMPDLETYRGLSGLASLLLVLLVVGLHRERAVKSAWLRSLPVLVGACFAAKVCFEMVTGAALFVNEADQFVPVPIVHLVGGVVGFAIATCADRARGTHSA